MNANAQHTPGPWNVKTSNREQLCVVADTAWICGEIDNNDLQFAEEWAANARLIAAAPDLLEVANEVSEWEAKYPADRVYGHMETIRIAKEMTAIVEKARAAIANATGAAS